MNPPGFAHLAGFYRKDVPSRAINDFTPINNQEFLVIERDGGQGAAAYKKIFLVDITGTPTATCSRERSSIL